MASHAPYFSPRDVRGLAAVNDHGANKGCWVRTVIIAAVAIATFAVAAGPSGIARAQTPANLAALPWKSVNAPVATLGFTMSALHPAASPSSVPEASLAGQGLNAVFHAKGSKGAELTLNEAAAWLLRPNGHGALFEQLVADDIARKGARVDFTKAGNIGTDLRRFPGHSHPMTFVQAKATASAMDSAVEGLLDGLAFAGHQANRGKELLARRIAFTTVIPADQCALLMKQGQLLSDGRPTANIIDRLLPVAVRRAQGTGEESARLRAALPQARMLLQRMTVEPGPVAYPELLRLTQRTGGLIQTLASRAGPLASQPIAQFGALMPVVDQTGKFLRGAGVVLSPLQVWQGIEELQQGKTVQGIGRAGLGATSAGGAAASGLGKAVLSGSMLGAGAAFDGALDLHTGITEANESKIAIGSTKCAVASGMVVGLTTANPLLVVISVVVYGSVTVVDVVLTIGAEEQRSQITALRGYLSRTATLTLPPSRYVGIGLSPADEELLLNLSNPATPRLGLVSPFRRRTL